MIEFEILSEKNVREIWEAETVCFPDDPWTLNMFLAEINNKISVYIAARDTETGKIVAYGGIWMMYDMADITNIAVIPEYRREGLGSRVLDLLNDIAKEHNMTALTLEVRESNVSAIVLYEKHGFERNGLRKNYYKNKENAVLMIKKLKSCDDNENFGN